MLASVVSKVFEARQEFCHSLSANVYIVHPDDLKDGFPLNIDSMHLFDISEVRMALESDDDTQPRHKCGWPKIPSSEPMDDSYTVV